MADATEALPFRQHVLVGTAGCTRRRRGATLCRGSSLPKESIHTCAQHGGTREVSEPSQYRGLQHISQGSLWSWQHHARTPGAKPRVPGNLSPSRAPCGRGCTPYLCALLGLAKSGFSDRAFIGGRTRRGSEELPPEMNYLRSLSSLPFT